MKYYVYQLRAINNEIPFYIGKGSGKRSKSHLTEALKGNVTYPQFQEIRKYWSEGIDVVDELLFCTNDELLAFEVERDYIDFYLGQIVNMRQVAEDYHPKSAKFPAFEYPRSLSNLPFTFHYVKRWRSKYNLCSDHDARANRIANKIGSMPVILLTDDQCITLTELMYE